MRRYIMVRQGRRLPPGELNLSQKVKVILGRHPVTVVKLAYHGQSAAIHGQMVKWSRLRSNIKVKDRQRQGQMFRDKIKLKGQG